MAEATLRVPAEHLDTLRRAALDEVSYWSSACEEDAKRIRNAVVRGVPDSEELAKGDLEEHHCRTRWAGRFLEQIPPSDIEGDELEVRGEAGILVSVTEQAARLCIRDLAAQDEFSPLVDSGDERVSRRAADLTWWLAELAKTQALLSSRNERVAA